MPVETLAASSRVREKASRVLVSAMTQSPHQQMKQKTEKSRSAWGHRQAKRAAFARGTVRHSEQSPGCNAAAAGGEAGSHLTNGLVRCACGPRAARLHRRQLETACPRRRGGAILKFIRRLVGFDPLQNDDLQLTGSFDSASLPSE